MTKENNDPSIWKYFKVGDIIKCDEDSVWSGKLFEISYFHGNAYLPLISAHFKGKSKVNGNACNFDLRRTKLINSEVRPLKKINTELLKKLLSKGNVEAKRETIIRLNLKKYNYV